MSLRVVYREKILLGLWIKEIKHKMKGWWLKMFSKIKFLLLLFIGCFVISGCRIFNFPENGPINNKSELETILGDEEKKPDEASQKDIFYDKDYSESERKAIEKIINMDDVREMLNNEKYKLVISEPDGEGFYNVVINDGIFNLENFQFKVYKNSGVIMRWYPEARSFMDLLE